MGRSNRRLTKNHAYWGPTNSTNARTLMLGSFVGYHSADEYCGSPCSLIAWPYIVISTYARLARLPIDCGVIVAVTRHPPFSLVETRRRKWLFTLLAEWSTALYAYKVHAGGHSACCRFRIIGADSSSQRPMTKRLPVSPWDYGILYLTNSAFLEATRGNFMTFCLILVSFYIVFLTRSKSILSFPFSVIEVSRGSLNTVEYRWQQFLSLARRCSLAEINILPKLVRMLMCLV
jgi:hypothetical protein